MYQFDVMLTRTKTDLLGAVKCVVRRETSEGMSYEAVFLSLFVFFFRGQYNRMLTESAIVHPRPVQV